MSHGMSSKLLGAILLLNEVLVLRNLLAKAEHAPGTIKSNHRNNYAFFLFLKPLNYHSTVSEVITEIIRSVR